LLQDAYPASSQVALEGLEQADDDAIWSHARDNGFVIVTEVSDFDELSLVRGASQRSSGKGHLVAGWKRAQGKRDSSAQ
jgi:predicted nuclease of predicted toxin-antitoxin system